MRAGCGQDAAECAVILDHMLAGWIGCRLFQCLPVQHMHIVHVVHMASHIVKHTANHTVRAGPGLFAVAKSVQGMAKSVYCESIAGMV